ncbi:MAG: amylo-alpha-1,6-glucosidase [Cytophagaceae bacterium]
MKIEIDKHIIQDFDRSSKIEWLETNGLGGFMSSTITLNNTRSYHGLFTVATKPPVERTVLLSKLDEFLTLDGKKYDLNVNQFSEKLCDEGSLYLHKFTKEIFPRFFYKIQNFEIIKTIGFIHGKNIAVITYEFKNAPKNIELQLKPYVAFRDYHSLVHSNSSINNSVIFGKDTLIMTPYYGQPDLHIHLKDAYFKYDAEWIMNFEYLQEKDRGMKYNEDLFSYGSLICSSGGNDKFCIIISTESTEGLDGFALLEEEKKRREELLKKMPQRDDLIDVLVLAGDQFLVKRGEDFMTIMAGYHWFSDWGRDTMISLPGLCLVTGRYKEAKKILKAFASYVDKGMIPNRFPDSGEEPEYNTVDATLWFFIAIKKYLDYSGDKEFVLKELLPVLKEVIYYHEKGTRYNIHVTEDGLLYAGQNGVQLTWMDAKIGSWVVTPRIGKPVEINALWYNSLMILEELTLLNKEEKQAEIYKAKADKVKASFLNTFVDENLGYLYDCVDGESVDKSLRPNQLFAFSLPYPLVDDDTARSILHKIEDKLVTPVGLRSLSPDDPQYKPLYSGDLLARDGAYHQGTVWSWLLGPYISSKVKLDGENGRSHVLDLLKVFKSHLHEAGIGTVSEVFDGQYPYQAKGCVAQAWGVAEVLRAYLEDVVPQQKNKKTK